MIARGVALFDSKIQCFHCILFCMNTTHKCADIYMVFLCHIFVQLKNKNQSTMMHTNNDYKPILVWLLSYLDNVQYANDTEFMDECLLQIMPQHILWWLNIKTFGIPDPLLDANPIFAWANSIMYWKKVISFFMPHHLEAWSTAHQEGNLMKSKELNDLISWVKKKEVHKQGVPPKDWQPLTEGKYRQMQTILCELAESGNIIWYGIPAMNNFQVHMISQIDCTCQWQTQHFKLHDVFPDFATKAKLSWSKNVNQEGDCPWQIVLGSMDPVFCVLVSTAIWLEYYLANLQGLSPYMLDFLGNFCILEGGDKSNSWVQDQLKKLFNGEEFIAEKDGPLGSHSTQKFASTQSRWSGATKDERDLQGCWKRDCHLLDRYDDKELLYPDAKVAALLCIRGPCSYHIKEGSAITDDWILEHIVPRIAAKYGPTLAKLLGKALLWTIFLAKSGWVSAIIINHVKVAYNNLVGGEAGEENPIEKRLLVVTGDDAMLLINEVRLVTLNAPNNNQQAQQQEAGQPQQGQQIAGHLEGQTNHQLLQTLLNQVRQLQTSVSQITEAREADRVALLVQFHTINANL